MYSSLLIWGVNNSLIYPPLHREDIERSKVSGRILKVDFEKVYDRQIKVKLREVLVVDGGGR